MEHKREKNYSIKNRIGFHYFPDSLHYRDKDLSLWLPRLKELDASYLVLNSPTKRAIPEDFISETAKQKIDPIINFDLPLSQNTPWNDLEILLQSYGKWGVKYALLNQQPNNQSAWGENYWKQPGLVKSYTEQFIRFANIALDCGIKPVFSPLVPGGDYWDLAFLNESFNILSKSAKPWLINNIVLSAYAWDFGKPLDWGLGGTKVWKDVKPYKVPKNSQDQRGFRTYEWYAENTKSILGKSLPIMLLQAGVKNDPCISVSKTANPNTSRQQLIYRLLKGENVYAPGNTAKLVSAISPQVFACNFYLLSAEDAVNRPYAWFSPSGTPLKTVRGIHRKYRKYRKSKNTKSNSRPVSVPVGKKTAKFKYGRYVLIAKSLKPQIQQILKTMHAYITRYKPIVGFSSEEAGQAAYILVIANENDFQPEEFQSMKENGSLVRILQPANLQASINQGSKR